MRSASGLGASAELTVLSPSGDQLWIEAQKTPHSQDPVTLSLITTSTGALVRQVTQLSPGGENLSFADAEEIDLSTGQTLTWPVTNPIIEGALTSFAW